MRRDEIAGTRYAVGYTTIDANFRTRYGCVLQARFRVIDDENIFLVSLPSSIGPEFHIPVLLHVRRGAALAIFFIGGDYVRLRLTRIAKPDTLPGSDNISAADTRRSLGACQDGRWRRAEDGRVRRCQNRAVGLNSLLGRSAAARNNEESAENDELTHLLPIPFYGAIGPLVD